MYWKEAQQISEQQFQRLTGVKKATYLKMVEVVEQSIVAHRKHVSRGRPCKLSIEDQVLMMLMYLREYRPFFHIGLSYGISEVQCWRIVTKVESALLQSKAFSLPGKKKLHQNSELQGQAVVVDVSEHPIERPKKNSGSITRAKRKDIHSKASW
jgi:Helix-turn-helix of DDE superfamily endonuclease